MLTKKHQYSECFIVGVDEDGNEYPKGVQGKLADLQFDKDGKLRSLKVWFNGNKVWFQAKDVKQLQLLEKTFTITHFLGDNKHSFDVPLFSDVQVRDLKQLVTPKSKDKWVDFTQEL